MKIPEIEWMPFDKNNPPEHLNPEEEFLVFLREDDYDDGKTWTYHVDIATPYGSYIDKFWDTINDWREGQCVEVLAYAHLPDGLKEDDLIEKKGEGTMISSKDLVQRQKLISKLKSIISDLEKGYSGFLYLYDDLV